MKSSTASRGAFAILVALPLLPVCGIVVDGPSVMMFFRGAISFNPHPVPLPEGEGEFLLRALFPWVEIRGNIPSLLRS
jgi:hypothetical protein